MKYVFIIGTEHQLFQVDMATEHFNIHQSDVILIIFEVIDTDFINKIKTSGQFDTVLSFKNWTFKDIFMRRDRVYSFVRYCQSLKNTNTEYTFFTSHYDSDPDLLFLSIVKPKKSYLMDEGTASFTVHNKRQQSIKKRFNYIIKSLLYLQPIQLPKHLIYFTQYNFKPHAFDRIEKYYVKKKNNPLMHFTEGEAVFIGSSIVEVGLLSATHYLTFLKYIIQDISKNKIYYYPHRKESKQKLAIIAKMGFDIQEQTEPFEKRFARLTECPSLFCALFVTGVLDNISKANETIPELRVYKFDTKLLTLHKEASVYDSIYNEMSSNNRLSFIELENWENN